MKTLRKPPPAGLVMLRSLSRMPHELVGSKTQGLSARPANSLDCTVPGGVERSARAGHDGASNEASTSRPASVTPVRIRPNTIA